LAGHAQQPSSDFADLPRRMPKLIEAGICPLHFARERFSLLCRQRAPTPSYEQAKTKVSLKLRNRTADMGLPDAKSCRRSRHSAIAHHGTKQVDVGRIHTCLICMEMLGYVI
jgi:hypothetical protein